MKPETNKGYVYFFKCLNFKNQYKIGYSKNPTARATHFGSIGLKIEILKTIKSDRAMELESELQGEFYRYSHWNILQKLCNSKTVRKKGDDLVQPMYKYATPSVMSCEWFYLKPKRIAGVLDAFEKSSLGVVV
jgi:hypothetical protein